MLESQHKTFGTALSARGKYSPRAEAAGGDFVKFAI